MKKWILYSVLAVSTALLYGQGASQPAEITLKDDTLYYQGDLSMEALAQFQQFTQEIRVPLRTLKINSPGGNILAGMGIAEFVKQHKLDVEVHGMCFSSCANYVFMAGAEKRIHPDTLLGWHGDGTSTREVKGEEHIKQDLRKQIAPYFADEKQLEEVVQQQWTRLFVEQTKAESQFYQTYNIDPRAIRYGHQNPKVYAQLIQGGYMGWTFSPQVMRQLNIQNVKLVAGQWHPKAQGKAKLLYIDKLE